MSCDNVIAEITRGSDFAGSFKFNESVGTPVDLTGYTYELLDLSTSLVSRITLACPAPLTGVVTFVGEGNPLLAVGQHSFRVRVTSAGGRDIASPLLVLLVK